jgi:hypothetical protein
MARFGISTPEPGRLKTVASNRVRPRDELESTKLYYYKRGELSSDWLKLGIGPSAIYNRI